MLTTHYALWMFTSAHYMMRVIALGTLLPYAALYPQIFMLLMVP